MPVCSSGKLVVWRVVGLMCMLKNRVLPSSVSMPGFFLCDSGSLFVFLLAGHRRLREEGGGKGEE